MRNANIATVAAQYSQEYRPSIAFLSTRFRMKRLSRRRPSRSTAVRAPVGLDVPWILGQVGHADSKMTMGVYAQLQQRVRRERDFQGDSEMARPGLEPGTPRFSVVCSTN